MSLDLAELVSVTNNAVRSLEKSQSSSGSEKLKTFRSNFDSPFNSPRSLRSASDIKDPQSYGIDSGAGTSATAMFPTKMKKEANPRSTRNGTGSHENKDSHDFLDNQTCTTLSQADANSDSILKVEQGNRLRSSMEQDGSFLDKSRDLCIVATRHETTTSDNNLGSSQGSKASAKDLKINAVDSNLHHKAIHFNVSRGRPKESIQGGNVTDSSNMFSDPEIIDVPECIIAIKSGMNSASEEDSTFNEIDTVVEANLPQNRSAQVLMQKSFGKVCMEDFLKLVARFPFKAVTMYESCYKQY